MIKEDVKVEVTAYDTVHNDGEKGESQDGNEVYATISAEHKAKKRWKFKVYYWINLKAKLIMLKASNILFCLYL